MHAKRRTNNHNAVKQSVLGTKNLAVCPDMKTIVKHWVKGAVRELISVRGLGRVAKVPKIKEEKKAVFLAAVQTTKVCAAKSQCVSGILQHRSVVTIKILIFN